MIMIDAHSLHVKLFFGHAPRMKIIRITILSAHMGGELNLMCFLEKLCGKKSCFLKKKYQQVLIIQSHNLASKALTMLK